MHTTMTQLENQMAADCAAGIEILGMPEELDLVTADSLVGQGWAAIACRPRLLLLDLASLCFCDARGLGAFVQIANRADAAGCRYGLVAPQPRVAKLLRIGGLNRRLPVFATMEDAVAGPTAIAGPGRSEAGKPREEDSSPTQTASFSRPVRFPAAARDHGAWMPGPRSA
jgi:anti-sigma B factor antagonist